LTNDKAKQAFAGLVPICQKIVVTRLSATLAFDHPCASHFARKAAIASSSVADNPPLGSGGGSRNLIIQRQSSRSALMR
jgi:hypothetical protein